MAVWAEILRRVPGSCLRLRFAGFEQFGTRAWFEGLFAANGVEPERLELLGWSPRAQMLADYNRIDIALDPFPYSGGITTCEALWMGVPVITCPGKTFAGRHSLSHLSNVGFVDTIVQSTSDYVTLAVRLANDLPRLAKRRAELRPQMARSPLCDEQRFAKNLSALLCAPHGKRTWRRQLVHHLHEPETQNPATDVAPDAPQPLPTFDLALTPQDLTVERMESLRRGLAIQLTAGQLLAVNQSLLSKPQCRFLVFGLGNDSILWQTANRNGRTVFLEDNPAWLDSSRRAFPTLESYLLTYPTKLYQWRELLHDPTRLRLALPPSIADTRWDVVLVDGPAGWRSDAPGRMCSIYAASVLAADDADLFVHDCEREVEAAYCDAYLKADNLVEEVGAVRAVMRHYRLRRAKNE